MNSGELLEKIRDVVGPQCEDASAAVLALRELLGLSPKSGESVDPLRDFFSQVRRSGADLCHDSCFLHAGQLLGFSMADRCPSDDRQWIADASDELRKLSLLHFDFDGEDSRRLLNLDAEVT